MLRYIQRRRIKKVIKLLSPMLVKGYGSRDYFSLGQVNTSVSVLCKRQQQIALALFANPDDLDLDNSPSLKLLRNDISNDFSRPTSTMRKMCLTYWLAVAGKVVE